MLTSCMFFIGIRSVFINLCSWNVLNYLLNPHIEGEVIIICGLREMVETYLILLFLPQRSQSGVFDLINVVIKCLLSHISLLEKILLILCACEL